MTFTPPSATGPSPNDAEDVNVMIVDDSLVIRGFIARSLENEKGFKIVATASNGQLAVDMLKRKQADVIILDIEMPVMDGMTAIPKLKEIDPDVQIVMASTLTQRNAEISLKALSLGATDYLAKPSAREMAMPGDFHRNLKEKVRALGLLAHKRRRLSGAGRAHAVAAVAEKKYIAMRSPPTVTPDIIAIGSSTGGPEALFQVIKTMGKGLKQPVVITQHMPPSFTTILADHIGRQCGVTCVEAKEGDILKQGQYYIAPGDFHMLFVRGDSGVRVRLTQDPPENYCRPAVDPMLRSLAGIYGGRILVVILTGMGQDGTKGAETIVKLGGAVVAQDESTSVVWGMPGSVANAGLCFAISPLANIGAIVRSAASPRGYAGGSAV
ncbi:MAG: chemotaxis response regulator protein-glutamate methylesterase [Alphaproteobacteria bacterium]|nr:chemotaxis response regulator protein-glutamate methylesterase [Alphaproteobacteria bacterium]